MCTMLLQVFCSPLDSYVYLNANVMSESRDRAPSLTGSELNVLRLGINTISICFSLLTPLLILKYLYKFSMLRVVLISPHSLCQTCWVTKNEHKFTGTKFCRPVRSSIVNRVLVWVFLLHH